MARIVARVGPCLLRRRRDYFVVLCRAILAQQISTAAAATVFARLRDQFPNRRPTPAGVLDLIRRCPESARACGLSRQKTAYLADLSRKFLTGEVPTRRFATMTDEQIIDSLTQVHGIGRWTAEMFLIFVLNRPDLLPVDDLGLRAAVQRAYGLRERPAKAELVEMAEPWRPYRSIATWYLWRMPQDFLPTVRAAEKKKAQD